MEKLTRRELGAWGLGVVGSYGLLRTLFGAEAFAQGVRPLTDRWLGELRELCLGVRSGKLPQTDWQAEVERLAGELPLPDLLAAVDFEKLSRSIKFPDDRAETAPVRFPQLEGLESSHIGTKLFGMKQGRAIVPHGHQNMASMHILLKGQVHLRHFDRVEDQPKHLVLRPTIDRMQQPGDRSSISDRKDNVHWLVATSESAFTLDVIVGNLDPRKRFPFKMDFVDPDHGEKLADGLIRARRIEPEEAFRLYGKS